MNDPKRKLGKVPPYEYDSSQFKAQLRANLMREYRQEYGVEEWAEAQPVRRGFNFKFAMAPVMAILVLTVFIGYEYFAQPMTAYAYMQKVQERHKGLEKGVKVRTTHVVGDTTYEIESRKDKHGNVHVRVVQEGLEVEDFVMKDGVLYVRPEVEEVEEAVVAEALSADDFSDENVIVSEEEAAELEVKRLEEEAARAAQEQAERLKDLTSIINSMVLAEVANPQDEWEEIMEREDAEFVEQEDGTVLITYEEAVDGEVFVNEYYFRDFAPVRKLRKAKQVNRAHEVVKTDVSELANTVEVVKYEEVISLDEVIEPVDHTVFVKNDEFNEKIKVFVEEEVDDLVEEFEELPEKDVYFAVWQDEKAESMKQGVPGKSQVIAELEEEVTRPVLIVDAGSEADTDATLSVMVESDVVEQPRIAAVSEIAEGSTDDSVDEMIEEEPLLPLADESPLPDQPIIEPVDESAPAVVRELPDAGRVVVPQVETLAAPIPVIEVPAKPFIRDVYLEEVFVDLLEDTPEEEKELPVKDVDSDKKELQDTERVDEGSDDSVDSKSDSELRSDVEKDLKTDGSDLSGSDTVPSDKDVPVRDAHTGSEVDKSDGNSGVGIEPHELIDVSQPEPYMAEPIDPVVVPFSDLPETDATVRVRSNTDIGTEVHTDTHVEPLSDEEIREMELRELEEKGDGTVHLDSDSPSYFELLEMRETWQRENAEKRFQDRMEDQLKELDPQEYEKESEEPKSEFER